MKINFESHPAYGGDDKYIAMKNIPRQHNYKFS